MDTTIEQLVENCMEWLRKCHIDAQDDESREGFHNRLTSFRLWCDSVGAKARSPASLDRRLRSQPDDLAMIKKMLTLFCHYLENYAESLPESQDTDEALRNVDSTFENLGLLGMAFQQRSERDDHKAAHKTENKHTYEEDRGADEKAENAGKMNQDTDEECKVIKENEDANEKMIYESLIKAIVSNPHSGKRFISRQKLQEICNERAVAKELARMFPENDTDTNERLTLSICYGRTKDPSIASQSCRKIFAILVLIHEPRLIESFLDHPLCDNDLPLSFDPRFYNALWAPKLKPIRHVKFPDDIDHYWVIKNFTNEQWSVLAPSFEADTTGKGCKVYEFHENDILPIEADPRYTYGSGSGLVEKVKIHSEHNGLGNDYFRLRTTRTSLMGLTKRDIRFKQELDAYQKGMVHIIEICAAFQQGDCRGFLFPWPGGGSLNDLWAKDPGNIVTTAGVKWSEFSRWICTQCHGIIKTIQAIHEPSGTLAVNRDRIQNDIRPHNILHFIEDGPPLGMLKFSDIRLMRFPRNGSWPGESFEAYLQYMAPEPNVRPWEVDTWAFGCLFAEFLTWAIRGRNGLEAFKLKREYDDRALSNKNRGRLVEANFFVIKSSSPGRPSQKSSIKEWFAELTDDLGPGMANTFFPQFLRIIEASMLEPNQERRADCEQVESYLGQLLQENPPDSPYWYFKGTTQYRKRRG